uniref:Uncharacterized protein n=1 Tax=Octopus bimaculoides TaxID=37653 RepID=A0A0L8HKI7_OCTBM
MMYFIGHQLYVAPTLPLSSPPSRSLMVPHEKQKKRKTTVICELPRNLIKISSLSSPIPISQPLLFNKTFI